MSAIRTVIGMAIGTATVKKICRHRLHRTPDPEAEPEEANPEDPVDSAEENKPAPKKSRSSHGYQRLQ